MLTGNGYAPLDGANPVPGGCCIAMASASTEAAWISPLEPILSRMPGGRMDTGAGASKPPTSPRNQPGNCNGHAERTEWVQGWFVSHRNAPVVGRSCWWRCPPSELSGLPVDSCKYRACRGVRGVKIVALMALAGLNGLPSLLFTLLS